MNEPHPRDLTHNLLLPVLLFAALGGMTWAVRGCSGFGAMSGCIFAGLMWAVAWWFIARESGPVQPRRYASGWIIPAFTIAMGISGARGWAQWSTMFEGRLQTNTAAGEWVPISPIYGFIWLFIAGVPWAGLAACALAWCGTERPTRFWQWAARFGFGLGTGFLLTYLFNHFPQYFMPLYRQIEDQYLDLPNNNNLRRLMNDNRAALLHLGWYIGFLLFEVLRRDWKNVTLIATVGVVNGIGWSLLQNWTWANELWDTGFNWWRCWESSGGISIGIALGIAYFLVNRPAPIDAESPPPARLAHGRINAEWLCVWLGLLALLTPFFLGALSYYGIAAWALCAGGGAIYWFRVRGEGALTLRAEDPNLERWAIYTGVLLGLGINLRNGLKGWANIYLGNEDYWSRMLWYFFGPLMLVMLLLTLWQWLRRPLPRDFKGDIVPGAYKLVWLVLILQNLIAQLVTGPHEHGSETAFAIYYLLLFAISAVILHHYHRRKTNSGFGTEARPTATH